MMYEDGIQEYVVRDEIEIIRDTVTGLHTVPSLGISAMALSVQGVPIALEPGDSMYCSPDSVNHIPTAYKAGLLSVNID